MAVDPAIRTAILGVIGLLVDGEYETLARMTDYRRLSAHEITHAIESYGRKLIMPPDKDLPPDLDLIEVEGVVPRRIAADMSLWTAEEGRSDLSLQLTLIDVGAGLWDVQIDDIHVL